MEKEEMLQVIRGLQERIAELDGRLNMKVDKNDVINQINISDEGILIESDKIRIDRGTISTNEINITNLD